MRLMVSMRANGMAPVTLRNMLPGSYHIYINAYDSEESVELRTQMFVDPFSVDIYLGNGVNSNVKKDTLARNSAGGKWFHVRAPDQSLVGTRALECGEQRDSGLPPPALLHVRPIRSGFLLCPKWRRASATRCQ